MVLLMFRLESFRLAGMAAVCGGARSETAEEAVCLNSDAGSRTDPGRKVEDRRNAATVSIAEFQRPETIHIHRIAIEVIEQAAEVSAVRVKSTDVSGAIESGRAMVEIADEQSIAELAEFRRRKRDAPRIVERTARCEAADEIPVHVEDVHGPGRALVGDEEIPIQIDDVKRPVARWKIGIVERTGESDLGETLIENIHSTGCNIRSVEDIAATARSYREAGVNSRRRSPGSSKLGCVRERRRRHSRTPTRDSAIQRREDETRRPAGCATRNDEIGSPIEDLPGRALRRAD